MNLVKFFSAVEPAGARALQGATPMLSTARRGLLTRNSGLPQHHNNSVKEDNFNRLLMDKVKRDMHTTSEHQRQVQAAIARAGMAAPSLAQAGSASLLSTPARSFATKKQSSTTKKASASATTEKKAKKATQEASAESSAQTESELAAAAAEPTQEKKSSEQPTEEAPKQEQKQSQGEDTEEDFERKAEFKAHRKFMFMMGKMFKYTCWFVGSLFLYHYYVVTNKDKPEAAPGVNEQMLIAAYNTRDFYYFLRDLLTKPPVDSLLMERPPTPPGYQSMKTLVLNVSGTLTHSEYKLGVGFEILKRPGLSVFLSQMAQNYEMVLFGDQERSFIEEIAMALDPNQQMFTGHLGRECTIVKDGKYIKDFSYLGRPVKEVIYIDFTKETAPHHPDNVIVLPEFTGDLNDRALYEIIPFLKHLAAKPGDVREEIRMYGSENTAQQFNAMRAQRRNIILRQQERGLSGVMSNLSKAQSLQTDEQRRLKEDLNMSRGSGFSFGDK